MQLDSIYCILLDHYGPQGWWPLFNDRTGRIEYHPENYELPQTDNQRFQISLGAILTQNTSWKNVEKTLLALHRARIIVPEKLRSLAVTELATLIKSSGYYTQKAKKIHAFLDFLISGLPVTREHLLAVWGIGPETADSLLLYAYRHPVFVIDTYTKRICSRLSGKKFDHYAELQALFHIALPHDISLYQEYHALLVAHAKRHCTKTNPSCTSCPLQSHCDYGRKS